MNNIPAWMTARPSASTVDADKPDSSNVEPWFLPIMENITAMDVATCLPMPIQINNNLPCVDFVWGRPNLRSYGCGCLWTLVPQ